MSPIEYDEVLKLIDRACDDRCDGAKLQRLETILRNDPAAVQTYVDYRDMHATLCWLTAPEDAQRAYYGGERRIASLLRPPTWDRLKQRLNRASFLVLAASLLLCALSFQLGVRWEVSDRRSAVNLAAPATGAGSNLAAVNERPDGVARITGLVDCHWLAGQQPFRFGNRINRGERVELDQGLLQLTFSSGAKVIIQGPASFVPQSAMEAQLVRGKLTAVVSESARGYTVKTPTAEVVDLGTEFALEVEDNGETELHVLQGDVVARQRSSSGELSGESIHARKHQAVWFGNREQSFKRIAADPERFVRQITPKLTLEELPPLPTTDKLKFWVAADLLVNRSEGRVSAWRDVCIGDNQISNDACQFSEKEQPLWIADAGNGRPAIRFNGNSTRLTTDAFKTGDQVTVFVACIPSAEGQANRIHGGQLLNFGGQAPTIELAVHHDRVAYAGLWAANAFGEEITTGVVNQELEIGKPTVLCYLYDIVTDRAELWVNGQSQGAVSAPLRAETTSTRSLGAHGDENRPDRFFRGDIHEVLVYDAALLDQERVAVGDYLRKRYAIE